MLYTKPINEISWDDIEEFCQQKIRENAYLDYKEDFPKYLENTISAMANTFGGVILIGVEADNENRPRLPLKGIPFMRGLSEQVTSIILTNIIPPVFPEIQPCKNEAGDKAIIVVRVPQSHQTPHAISKNTKVYLRTGDINNPEDLATIDDVIWLIDNRNKSVNLRENLYKRAENRYKAFRKRVIESLSLLDKQIQTVKVETGLFNISTCPTFPRDVYRNPSLLSNIHEKIRIKDYFLSNKYFPPENNFPESSGTIVQDGVVFLNHHDDANLIFYTEINSLGLYFYQQTISRVPKSKINNPRDILGCSEVVTRIDEFLDSADKFYNEIGYRGYINLIVSLLNIQEIGLSKDWIKDSSYQPFGFCPDNEVKFTSTILAGDLVAEKKKSLVFESTQKLLWAFGIDITQNDLEIFFGKYKPI